MSELKPVAEAILTKRTSVLPTESVLAAVSGIDGSGKGYVTARLVAELQKLGVHAVGVNVDGWLNLPSKRFKTARPAEHFLPSCHSLRGDVRAIDCATQATSVNPRRDGLC